MIEQRIRLEGALGDREVTALFDSGTSVSCIRPDVVEHVGEPVRLRTPLRVDIAHMRAHFKEIRDRVALDFYIGEYRFASEFYLVPGLAEEVVIGAATMRQWRFKLDFEREEVIVDPSVTRMRM